jgi:hypothetical protein
MNQRQPSQPTEPTRDDRAACPECGPSVSAAASAAVAAAPDRRAFLRTAAGGLAAAVGAGVLGRVPALAAESPAATATTAPAARKSETLAAQLFSTLTDAQKQAVALPYGHERRRMVNNNWAITKPMVKDLLTGEQQALVRELFDGLVAPEWKARFAKQMKDDTGGGDITHYHLGVFGAPQDKDGYELVITGRHLTVRCDGAADRAAAFGGPIFYGHAADGFNESPTHPGNVFWPQALRVNELFRALDGRQRSAALLDKAPDESAVHLPGSAPGRPGLAVSEMSADQKALMKAVLADLLAPFRPADAADVAACIEAGGGADHLHLSVYRKPDAGGDGIWDVFRVEGPTMVWNFRAIPHVHCWVNVARTVEAGAYILGKSAK